MAKFEKTQDGTQFVHLCDRGKRPYAKIEFLNGGAVRLTCPLCGHVETRPHQQGHVQ